MAKKSGGIEPSEFLLWLQAVPQEEREVVATILAEIDPKVPTDVAKIAMKLMVEVARGRVTPAIATELRELLTVAFQAVTFELSLKKQEKHAPNQFLLMLTNSTAPPQLEVKEELPMQNMANRIAGASLLADYSPDELPTEKHATLEGE